MTFSFNRLGILVLLLLLLSGCGDGRVAIQGSVAVNGNPIKTGVISFKPANAVASGPSAVITDGKYLIPAKKGVMPGEYFVQIHASEDTGKFDTSMPGPPIRIIRQLVPPKYNLLSELKVSIARGQSCNFDLVVKEEDFKEVGNMPRKK